MKLIKFKAIFSLLLMALLPSFASNVYGQTLDGNSKLSFTLSDKTEVTLFANFYDHEDYRAYYYLPVNLRIALRDDSIPEFSFMSFRQAEGEDISGGLLHWLLTWGLTKEQQEEIQEQLYATTDSSAILMGAVAVEASESFQITSDEPIADILRNSLTSKGNIPLNPGGKLAASFLFSGEDAVKVEEAIKKHKKVAATTVKFKFQYSLQETRGAGRIPVTKSISIERSLSELFQQFN